MKRAIPFVLILLVAFLRVATLAQEPTPSPVAQESYWPTHGWRSSTPEAQGMDSEVLARAFDYIRQNRIPIHSLLIVRNGYVVLDAYFYPFQEGQVHDGASMTKSITSTLIAIAIGEHKLSSVRQPTLSVFPGRNVANRDERKDRMTVEDLLTMTSGLDCHVDHGEITLREMMQSKDWVQFMLDRPMVAEPGSKFEYCSGGMHLLSGIVSETTGSSELEFARRELFQPLGIEDVIWPSDPQGVSTGWGISTCGRATWPRLGTCGSTKGAGKAGKSSRRSGCRRQRRPTRIPGRAMWNMDMDSGSIHKGIPSSTKRWGAEASVST